MTNIEENCSVPLYNGARNYGLCKTDKGFVTNAYCGEANTDVKKILKGHFYKPTISQEKAVDIYLKNIRDKKKCQKIFSPYYLKKYSENIVNVELVYASIELGSSSYKTGYKVIKVGRIDHYENGWYRGSTDAYDTEDTYTYYDYEVADSKILDNFSNGDYDRINIFGDKRPEYNYTFGNNLFNELNRVTNNEIRIFSDKDVCSFDYSTSEYIPAYIPIYIITIKEEDKYHYSFIDGIKGKYDIGGDNKKYDVKAKLSRIWNKTAIILATLMLFAVFIMLCQKYLLSDFLNLSKSIYNFLSSEFNVDTSNSDAIDFLEIIFYNKILVVIFGILFTLVEIIYSVEFLAGFVVGIILVVFSMRSNKNARLSIRDIYPLGIKAGFGRIFKFLAKIAITGVVFAAAFGLMYLWVFMFNNAGLPS